VTPKPHASEPLNPDPCFRAPDLYPVTIKSQALNHKTSPEP